MTGRRASTGSEPVAEPETDSSAKPETDPSAEATESVPGYRGLARIGHGGFSVVYRAVQESFERDVALKVLTVGPDEDARRRFLREIRLAGRLSGHPHVVTVLDTGTTRSGRPYLAMDLYDGGSMRDRLARSGPLSAAETAAVGAKIAEALAAAHALGVLHRDVKPNNILISRFGEPALADFGVSCLLDSSSSASVLDVFSPQHAAPELMTRGVLTTSSDIYALGSTLYQLLTGQPPFGGPGRDVRSIMWRAVSEPPPRPECPELPELADAIVRAMAKEPGERFRDAAEFARTLRALTPEGTQPLSMPDLVETLFARPVAGAALPVDPAPEPVADTGTGSHTSTSRRLSSDETMLRPDRADPARHPVAAVDSDIEGADDTRLRSRLRRTGKPIALALAVVLLGVTAWAILTSQDSSTHLPSAAASQHPTVTASADSAPTHASTKQTTGPTSKPKRSTAPAAMTGATTSTGAHASATASASSSAGGSVLSLPGSFHRLQNVQTGDCLSAPGGSATAQQACAQNKSQGWQNSLSLQGILAAGSYELVNEQSGLCLTVSTGARIVAQSCDGGSAQLWSTVSGPGSSKEFQNESDGQCLRAAQGVVSSGSCSTSDRADLWNEDGTA